MLFFQVRRQLASTLTKGFQYAFNIGFSLAFVSAFYVLFYVRERVCKSKHLQIVSGVEGWTYWSASFIWDLFLFLGPTLGIILTFAAFQEEGFRSTAELGKILNINK
jgi:ATP-binding cassette subfamily A (ABC1) protein 3